MKASRWVGCIAGVAMLAGSASVAAQQITLQAGFMPDPYRLAGISGGPVRASALNPACRGHIPLRPQHRVMVRTPMNFLRVWVQSHSDTTLVVRAPTGQLFCADDTWGVNPGVDLRGAPPGMYQVFVGSYSPQDHQPYRVGFTELPSSTPDGSAVAAAPPPAGFVVPSQPAPVVVPQQPPQAVVVQQPAYGYGAAAAFATGFMPDPRMFTGVSGGVVQAGRLNPACRGWIPNAPNHTFALTTPFNFLRIWAQAQGDTTLVVRAPTGQLFCADDTWGNNPGVDLRGAPPGTYQVFVGSYSAGARYGYQLAVTELPSSTPGGVAVTNAGYAPPPPPPALTGMYGSVSLASGFMPDPQQLAGVSGGPMDASAMHSGCRGYVAARPDHVMQLHSGFSFLRVYVASESDTTLMIRGPRGEVYCADDTFGLNPGIDLRGAPPGTYQVFVGSYSPGDHSNYTIGFTEYAHVRP